jgi:cis-3-alkyl-4-acyloxetan-2-one decarboxylase
MTSFLEKIRQLYDFDSRFLELVGGHRLHYLDEGSGEPVLLLHGNPTWSFMYRDLIRTLRPAYRVVAPDFIGCGLSSKPDDGQYRYEMERRAADLAEFIDIVLPGPGTFTLGVHDWGGPIGFRWAVRNPDRIRRLVVFNTAAFRVPEGRSLHWTIRFCRRSMLAAPLIRGLNAFCLGAGRLGFRHPPGKDVRFGYRGPYDSWANRIAVLRFVQDIPLSPGDPSYAPLRETEEGLAALRDKPALILWGDKDFVFDSGFLEEWRERLPGARVRRFPEAGHYVLEDAFPEVAAAVGEFLSTT